MRNLQWIRVRAKETESFLFLKLTNFTVKFLVSVTYQVDPPYLPSLHRQKQCTFEEPALPSHFCTSWKPFYLPPRAVLVWTLPRTEAPLEKGSGEFSFSKQWQIQTTRMPLVVI